MVLIITGIFIQFLGLAVQVIQLRLGRPDDPGPGHREAAAAEAGEADEHETAQACLELKHQDPADD